MSNNNKGIRVDDEPNEEEVVEYLTVRFIAISEYARLYTLLPYYNKVLM